MKVLALGDTVGKPGRQAIQTLLPKIKEQYEIDFVVLNGENLAGGSGITTNSAQEIFTTGVDVITNGDHVWDQKESLGLINTHPRILRPANFPEPCPGQGFCVTKTSKDLSIAVVNLLGRIFLKPIDCPFKMADKILSQIPTDCRVIIVDMHAEATSEKIALGWYLDGKISALFGTHTHIPTADEQILPHGTGYITDVGMTGPYKSVIGREIAPVLERFLYQRPSRFHVAEEDIKLCGVIFDIDEKTGRASHVQRIQEKLTL